MYVKSAQKEYIEIMKEYLILKGHRSFKYVSPQLQCPLCPRETYLNVLQPLRVWYHLYLLECKMRLFP